MTITPKQFNQLATKDDLKKLESRLASKKDFNKVLNAVDGLAKRFDTIETESKMDKLAHDRMQKQIDKLELKTTP
ncbi:MAG: hypothetical protein V1768_02725 [Patescibacteria group bacterium]|nr:hypothetical protein [Patescibacteria group bacterium]